jgi:RND family efflux transporter MFP subunit
VVLEVVRPERLDLEPSLVGIGRVEPRRRHLLSSVASARLLTLEVDNGDPVRSGQLLGELDAVDLPERLRSGQAAWQRSRQARAVAAAQGREAQASLNYVRSNTARFERLAQAGAVSDDALLERRQALARAGAAAASAQANEAAATQAEREAAAALAALRAQQRSLQLVAPTAGIVTRRLLDPGSTVVPGQPVLEIADPGKVWIDVRFDQRQATGLAVGQPATVEFRRLAGRRFAGRIARIEPSADSLTEELNAKVTLLPGQRAVAELRPSLGELAEVRVALAAAPGALTVPALSLRQQRGRLGVWLAGDQGLTFAPLQLGRSDGEGRVEVLGGLAASARVLLRPPADPAAVGRYRLQELAGGSAKADLPARSGLSDQPASQDPSRLQGQPPVARQAQ